MSERYTALISLLVQLRNRMEQEGRWQSVSPAPSALASTEPFCVDTLRFEQWLQWVMIPRFEAMVEAGMPLPSSCSIAPYALEVLPESSELVAVITSIDQLCSTG